MPKGNYIIILTFFQRKDTYYADSLSRMSASIDKQAREITL